MSLQRNLYQLASLLELITGAALVILPATVMELLFGSSIEATGNHIAQLYGLALIGLGLASWGIPCPKSGKIALLFYNNLAGLLLLYLAFQGIAQGFMVWPAAILHLALGLLIAKERFSHHSD